MALTDASRLADFGSGIGTPGSAIVVDHTNNTLGVGTDSVLSGATLQVGTGVTIYGNSGIVSAVSFYGDGSNLTGVASTDNIITDTLAQFNGAVGIADSIFHIGDTNTAIRFPANDVVTVETGGEERTRVTTTGLGIGTDNPSRSLDICFDSESGIELRNYTAGKNLQFLVKDDGTGRIVSPSDKSLQFDRAGTVSLTINSSGILGVNTTTTINPASFANPFIQVAADDVNKSCISVLNDQNNANQPAFIMAKRRLSNTVVSSGDVLGTVAFQGWDGDEFLNGGLISCLVDATAGNGDLPTRMAFYTTADGASSPTERMRITNQGGLKAAGAGAALVSGTSPLQSHELASDVNGAACLYIVNRNSSSPVGAQVYFGTDVNNTANNFFECFGTSNLRAAIRSNGGLSNYQSNNTNLCDEREKKNIVDLDSTWGCLKNWELKKFHYNEDADDSDLRYGVIAQQIATHCPEVIADWVKQQSKEEVLDEDGNVVTPAQEEIVRMGVKEQQMMWMAIKALQEAQTRIETLEAEVAALKGA